MSNVLTKDQAKKNCADNLAAALAEKGMKPVDLARAVMTGDDTETAASMRISRYLRAIHLADGAELANMAEALGKSVDWLLQGHRKKSRRAG